MVWWWDGVISVTLVVVLLTLLTLWWSPDWTGGTEPTTACHHLPATTAWTTDPAQFQIKLKLFSSIPSYSHHPLPLSHNHCAKCRCRVLPDQGLEQSTIGHFLSPSSMTLQQSSVTAGERYESFPSPVTCDNITFYCGSILSHYTPQLFLSWNKFRAVSSRDVIQEPPSFTRLWWLV